MPFDGLRVLALESRRAMEMERLILKQGGQAFVAPSMREIPLERNPQALEFAERLFRDEFDMVIFLTGVGTRLLGQIIETHSAAAAIPKIENQANVASQAPPVQTLSSALRRITVIARGPKPMAVLREWGVPAILVPEPNTWHEVLAAVDSHFGDPNLGDPPDAGSEPIPNSLAGKRIAIQEYGQPSIELMDRLTARGADVMAVPVYQWELPEDLEPLRQATRRLAAREFDVILLTSSIQVTHLLRIAEELELKDAVNRALQETVVASIGPTTSETLRELGLHVDLEPSHPKMGLLVNETAVGVHAILKSKSLQSKQ